MDMSNEFPQRQAIYFGWETAKKNIKFFVVALLVVFAISFIFSSLDSSFADEQVVPRFIVGIVSWVVSSITSIGLIWISLNFVDKKESKYSDLFKHYDRTVNYMAASILYGLIVAFGLLLLVVPGIYFGLRLQFFSYFVVEQNVGPVQALRMSWNITKNRVWKLLLFGLTMIGINILGFLLLLVGMFWTIPTTQLATAYLFRHLAKK